MKARHERKSYHNTSDIHSQKREFIPNNEHPLNILITNHHLLDFTGSEVFTFTLADFLKRAGHNVTIYSKYLDRICNYFVLRNIPVVNDLNAIKDTHFDVAHVHHNINALEVRYFFPTVPIVFLSHGVLPFLEQPPIIDLHISQFLAVSEEVRTHLIGILGNDHAINLYRNIIDSTKFRPLSKIQEKPRNALVLSNRIDTLTEQIIRRACSALEMKCDFVGLRFGEIENSQVPLYMNKADIVFSLGRGAIEAMMCARVPLVYDYMGGDGLVTPSNFQDIMKSNFSGRCYRINFTEESLIEEIKKYKAVYGEELQEIAYSYFDAKNKIDEIIEIYNSIVEIKVPPLSPENQTLIDYITSSIIESRSYTKNLEQRRINRLLNNDILNPMDSSKYICSIVIPVFNNLELTKQCIEKLIKNTPEGLYEVIIVDNASTDGTHEFLMCLDGDATVITNDVNLGFAKACNQGARAASGKYLVFLNNDTIPHAEWLTELINVADKHEDIGVVGSKLLFPDGTIQHAGVVIVETPSGKLGNHLYWGYPGDFPPANRARDFEVVTAACMLISKDLFFQVGCFDERYVNGMEDVDLCLKIRKTGKRVFYCPNSILTHFESKTEGRFDKVSENERLFIQLWDDKIEADRNTYLMVDGFRREQLNGTITWVYHEKLFNKLLSIIITDWDSLDGLGKLIRDIKEYTSMPSEILVIDTTSNDSAKDNLKDLQDIKTVFLRKDSNSFEWFRACIKESEGDYIAFISSEIRLTNDWDTQFILHFNEYTGAVSTYVYNYNDLMSFKDILKNPLTDDLDLNSFTPTLSRWNKGNYQEIECLDSRCFMVERSIIDKLVTPDGTQSTSKISEELLRRIKKTNNIIIRASGALVYTDESHSVNKYQESLFAGRYPNILHLLGVPLTSIIILTYNQLDYSKKCLQSICENTRAPYEIIIVDNGSTDGTREYLKNFANSRKNVTLILNDKNLGFATGNNQGIEKARGSYLLLMNNDVVVTEGWLEKMISHLEQSPHIGMVGPMSNAVSGPQLVQKVPYGSSLKSMQRFARDFASTHSGKSSEFMRLVGFCLLIRKEVIDVIGGLDKSYKTGNYEDDDLCLRSYIAGYQNMIAQDVFIHHFGSMTFKGNSIDYTDTMNTNRFYFLEKWKGIVESNSDGGYRVHFDRKLQVEQLNRWGESAFDEGDVLRALKIFKRALIIAPRNTQVLNNIGVIQWELGHQEAAIDTFQAAIAINPGDSDSMSNIANAIAVRGGKHLLRPEIRERIEKHLACSPVINRQLVAQEGF